MGHVYLSVRHLLEYNIQQGEPRKTKRGSGLLIGCRMSFWFNQCFFVVNKIIIRMFICTTTKTFVVPRHKILILGLDYNQKHAAQSGNGEIFTQTYKQASVTLVTNRTRFCFSSIGSLLVLASLLVWPVCGHMTSCRHVGYDERWWVTRVVIVSSSCFYFDVESWVNENQRQEMNPTLDEF